MSERDDLQRIIELVEQGKRSDARSALLSLEPSIKEPGLRLQLIDYAMGTLDNLKDNVKQIDLSIEGARIAAAMGRTEYQAHFMAKTADFLNFQVGLGRHRKSMLKLWPKWFQFATEADKSEYESLVTEIDGREREMDFLLSEAIALSEKSGDKRILASVLMSMGNIESARYLHYMMDCMRGVRATLWAKFVFMRYPFFEYLLTLWNGDAKKPSDYVKTFTNNYIKAAHLCEELDDPLAGHAYYNLAINLKSAYRFGVAERYLEKARAIALKHNDAALMQMADSLKQSIKAKNRDIPDYLRGETRSVS